MHAGVLLGFAVPCCAARQRAAPRPDPVLAEHFENRFRPISAGVAVPVFAFLAAGVTIGGLSGWPPPLGPGRARHRRRPRRRQDDRVFGSTYLMARFTQATLDSSAGRRPRRGGPGRDRLHRLIGEFAYGSGSTRDDHVKVGVLAGSMLAATAATIAPATAPRRRLQSSRRNATPTATPPDVYGTA